MHATIFKEKSSYNLVKGPLLLFPFAYHSVYFIVSSEAGLIPGDNVHCKMLIPGVEMQLKSASKSLHCFSRSA